jgi:alginate O-acetyltransferase complex protein AlgI
MEIISFKFALAAIASILAFYLLNQKYRIWLLKILSCGFIASFSYYLLIYILIYALINYFIGLRIPDSRNKIGLYRAGIIINISQLIFLRYASFAIDPVLRILGTSLLVSKLSEIIIPIGISYFTLQGIGYLINVKMGWEKPEKSFSDFLLYITFYPKFLSGPVERSNHFLPQIKAVRSFNERQVSLGLRLALFGFFKKVAIANQIAPFINSTYDGVNTADGSSLWFLLLVQPLYLYFDFSGYTDIAIGLAKAMGIDLLPNFNRPFFAENVTTFWKKFHISLSSWFNDYVFRQVSFRRRKWGIYASTYAVFLTFTLFGIWHGAGWNFMILGFMQALAINYEFFTRRWRLRVFSKVPDLPRIWFGRVATYLFYCISLVFFFSPDIGSTFTFFSHLFSVTGSFAAVVLNTVPVQSIAFILVFLVIELIDNDYGVLAKKIDAIWSGGKMISRVFRLIIYYYAIITIFVLGNEVQQFIYFKF